MARRALVAVLTVITAAGLSAQNRAANRKTASIAGRILHADGVAAEGARVAVYAVREGAPAAIVGTATSADDGRYEVTGLPAGRFVVGVIPQRIRGFGGESRRLTAKPVETLYPGTTDRTRAQPIVVFDGTPTEGIDVWLEPDARRYSISGRVSWPEGATVENVVIEYGGTDGVPGGIWYVHDPGGLFTIEGAARGTYVLLARSDTANGLLLGLAATDVSNDSVHDVRIVMRSPGAIDGRVVLDGTSGPDLSTLRVAPAQALLTVSPLYPTEEAAVDSNGRFSVPNAVGAYLLDVRNLPPGWRVRRVARAGTALPDNRVIVPVGERVTGIEVVVGNSLR